MQEIYRLKTGSSRPASSFSSVSQSKNLSVIENPVARVHSAPISRREVNKSNQDHFNYYTRPTTPTLLLAVDAGSLRGGSLGADSITKTKGRSSPILIGTKTSILVTHPEEIQQITVPNATGYITPPTLEEEHLEGKELRVSNQLTSNLTAFARMPSCEGNLPGSTAKKCVIFGGVSLFFIILTICIVADSIHTIEEGNIGIYFVQGALDDEISHPGIHWAIPFVTEVKEVTTRPVTSTLKLIRTITRDGIGNSFGGVQVISDVNTRNLIPLIKRFGLEFRDALIFDRISEELRIFCANHSVDEVYNELFLDIVAVIRLRVEKNIEKLIGNDSIKILNLVIPKPEIPEDIAANYKQVKVQWTEQLVAQQQQKTDKIKKETESIKAVLDAERLKKVLQIDIEKDILQKEGEQSLSTLNNAIIKEREENKANVENYKKTQNAEANKQLYTQDFVRLEMAKALSQNTKFFFSGESSPLGAILSKIMGESK